jgi:hypothetical protein
MARIQYAHRETIPEALNIAWYNLRGPHDCAAADRHRAMVCASVIISGKAR